MFRIESKVCRLLGMIAIIYGLGLSPEASSEGLPPNTGGNSGTSSGGQGATGPQGGQNGGGGDSCGPNEILLCGGVWGGDRDALSGNGTGENGCGYIRGGSFGPNGPGCGGDGSASGGTTGSGGTFCGCYSTGTETPPHPPELVPGCDGTMVPIEQAYGCDAVGYVLKPKTLDEDMLLTAMTLHLCGGQVLTGFGTAGIFCAGLKLSGNHPPPTVEKIPAGTVCKEWQQSFSQTCSGGTGNIGSGSSGSGTGGTSNSGGATAGGGGNGNGPGFPAP